MQHPTANQCPAIAVRSRAAYQSRKCSLEEVGLRKHCRVQDWPGNSLLCTMLRQLRPVFGTPMIDNIVEWRQRYTRMFVAPLAVLCNELRYFPIIQIAELLEA
jgi:hypothetical protein